MQSKASFWLSPKGISAIGFIAAVTYFLLIEHRHHVLPYLPYLILLLCPLMHFFMHHGHHDGNGQGSEDHRDHGHPNNAREEG